MTDGAQFRSFYAALVTGKGGSRDERIRQAFATIERERFCGPGPWHVFAFTRYIETPSDDLAFLYQDVLIGLIPERAINNGEPSLHARCLTALAVKEGERIVHIGTGTGYYTAILAELTGPGGSLDGYEIDPGLARRASVNLGDRKNIRVHSKSGTDGPLPEADVIYVNAGATAPLPCWLDALRPRGRLIFPLTPNEGLGGLLMVTKEAPERFSARFVSPCAFTPCIGARDDAVAERLGRAFMMNSGIGGFWNVRSLRRAAAPDLTCWFADDGWWLSTAAV